MTACFSCHAQFPAPALVHCGWAGIHPILLCGTCRSLDVAEGHATWFAARVQPHEPGHDWVTEEDGSPAQMWRARLQTGNRTAALLPLFPSREECERFIREQIMTATCDVSA